MKEPFLYRDQSAASWSLRQVVELVRLFDAVGATEQILAASDAAKVTVSLPPDTINFTKRHIFEAKLHKESTGLKAIVESSHCGRGGGADPREPWPPDPDPFVN